ncbi:MAG: ThiF family adenylyltransferase [Crocinitomicaceae bacterium]|nr:ThiF family adenylyltransferase [Crocinitomicaceae bacterium]
MKSLTEEEYRRYSRHIQLSELGLEGQEKLKHSSVLVIGAGGLGCPILLYLSAAGVGHIGIIDFDVVEESNLQRQILFDTNDLNRKKAEVVKEKLCKKNPFIEVSIYAFELTNKNALSLFSEYDIIIDGTDNFSTRYLINDACALLSKPLVYGAIHKFEGQVSVFNYKEGPTYRCLFPDPPSLKTAPSCSDVGVLGILPGIIGLYQGMEAVKIILASEHILSGKVLVVNMLTTTHFKIELKKTSKLENYGIKSTDDYLVFDYPAYCNMKSQETEDIASLTMEEFNEVKMVSIILDVRESWEVPRAEGKRIIEAPLNDIDQFVDQIPLDEQVIVICQKGSRSLKAIRYLQEHYNFNNLVNLKGGIRNG